MKNNLTSCKHLWRRYCHDTNGATAIEYGLIVALLSIALITGYKVVASSQNELFNNLSNDFIAA